MSLLRNLPIKRKLTIIILATSSIALLLACTAFVLLEQVNFRRIMARDLSITAQMIASSTGGALSANDPTLATQILESLSAQPHVVSASIYNRHGEVFATYGRDGRLNASASPPTGDHEEFGPNLLKLSRNIELAGESIGTIYLELDLEEMRERWERYAIIVGAVLLAAILTAFFIASKLQRVISEPILQLAAVADRVASERDYSLRAVKPGNDEVGRLIDGFNEMLTQIQARDLELASARDNLERRVEQRTAELQQEVADRKRAEVELAYERDLLRSLMDHAPDLVYFKDEKSCFIQGSKALSDYLGVRPEDLVGKNDFSFFVEKQAREALADEEKIMSTGQPLIGQIEKRTSQNGTTWWMLTTKMPLRDRTGKIVGTFGISKDITEIKRSEARLEEMHKQLLETSRRAGMAEVATGVLHNVGNVLNSINVSASIVSERVGQSQVARLTRLVALLHEHETDLASFLTADPKGQQVLGYLDKLVDQFAVEQKAVENELESLRKNVGHVKDIVAMQQSYGRVSGVAETVPVVELIEDAVRMNDVALDRHGVGVIREYEARPTLTLEKHKVLQILVNLIRNAKHACDDSGRPDKQLRLHVTEDVDVVKIAVIDNGVGIPRENLTRIFAHGFTTRKNGHGFGLHSGALAAKELGGTLQAFSEGPGRGATFVLELSKTKPPVTS